MNLVIHSMIVLVGRTLLRSAAGAMLWICFALTLLSTSNNALAGCHYQGSAQQETFQGGTDGRYAEYCWWSQGRLQRVYEGGRMVYYQIPSESVPCEGPNCRGSEPSESVRLVTTSPSHRVSLDLAMDRRELPAPTRTQRLQYADALQIISPTLDGILRPPRPSC